MSIRDVAAQNKSLDNDYGASKGANAAASHSLALFDGDPDFGGVELSGGGYARPTITNNGTNWPGAVGGQKKSAQISLAASTGAVAGVATHFGLLGSDGLWWDGGALAEEISITAAGVTKRITVTIFYDDRN